MEEQELEIPEWVKLVNQLLEIAKANV